MAAPSRKNLTLGSELTGLLNSKNAEERKRDPAGSPEDINDKLIGRSGGVAELLLGDDTQTNKIIESQDVGAMRRRATQILGVLESPTPALTPFKELPPGKKFVAAIGIALNPGRRSAINRQHALAMQGKRKVLFDQYLTITRAVDELSGGPGDRALRAKQLLDFQEVMKGEVVSEIARKKILASENLTPAQKARALAEVDVDVGDINKDFAAEAAADFKRAENVFVMAESGSSDAKLLAQNKGVPFTPEEESRIKLHRELGQKKFDDEIAVIDNASELREQEAEKAAADLAKVEAGTEKTEADTARINAETNAKKVELENKRKDDIFKTGTTQMARSEKAERDAFESRLPSEFVAEIGPDGQFVRDGNGEIKGSLKRIYPDVFDYDKEIKLPSILNLLNQALAASAESDWVDFYQLQVDKLTAEITAGRSLKHVTEETNRMLREAIGASGE